MADNDGDVFGAATDEHDDTGRNDAPQDDGNFNEGGNGNGAPEPPQQSEAMTIKIRNVMGFEVAFKMRPTTKLSKAMNAFANRCSRQPHELRFLIEGRRVLDNDTPMDLEIENGDTIDVHEEQTGGAF